MRKRKYYLYLTAELSYAKQQTYTTDRNVLLVECSQGGLVSALLAAKEASVRGLILLYPAFSIPDDARKGKMMSLTFDPDNIPEEMNIGMMHLGRCYVADVLNMKPYEHIRVYHGKVLILHGDKDGVVDIFYSEKANKTYIEAGADVEFTTIQGAGHIFLRRRHKEAAKRAILDFLKHLED